MSTPRRPTAAPAAATAHSQTFRPPSSPNTEATARSRAQSKDSALAGSLKALVLAGDIEGAHQRFAELVASQQRRALRIAYHYLRDAHDADEAVQDAFVKVFMHIATYREHLPFEVWFTRILVNGCLDVRKARGRRLRWALPMTISSEIPSVDPVSPEPTPEDTLVASERARAITAAVDRLPDRQRTVFTLSQVAGQTTSEIGRALGLSEATVRVHLFRAIRKLRRLLTDPRGRAGTDSNRGGSTS
jgi:RNA polymerase sigma-70 factor (ECF subfamily)